MNAQTVKEMLDNYGLNDRKVKAFKVFKKKGKFDALYDAEQYVKEQGYNKGSLCRNEPIALSKHHSYIAKWRNISMEEYDKIEGVILRENEEAVVVEFTEE
jgi:hypothetical protein